LTDTGIVIDAATSPDGTYIAFVESSGGRQGLYLRQLTGARQIELVPPSQVGFRTGGRSSFSPSERVRSACGGATPTAVTRRC